MPLIDAQVWLPRKDKGFLALAMHIGENADNAQATVRKVVFSFPVVIDVDNRFADLSARTGETVPAFPLAYLLDRKGLVRKIYTTEEPAIDALQKDVDALLAEPP